MAKTYSYDLQRKVIEPIELDGLLDKFNTLRDAMRHILMLACL